MGSVSDWFCILFTKSPGLGNNSHHFGATHHGNATVAFPARHLINNCLANGQAS